MLSLVTIEASHAAGLTATAKHFAGICSPISAVGTSFATHGKAGLSASSFLVRRPSVKAYRYHHERFKMLKMTMGWVLAPMYYIFEYPKIALFFFLFVTLFLAVLDECLYRYKRYPSLAEESTGAVAVSRDAGVNYALAANRYFFTASKREKKIHDTQNDRGEYGCSLLASSLIAQEPIIYDDKIALP